MDWFRSWFLLLAISFSILWCPSSSIRKELRDKDFKQESVIQLVRSVPSNRFDPSRVLQLSWRPRVFQYSGFLSEEECDYLIALTDNAEENVLGMDSRNISASTHGGISIKKHIARMTQLNTSDEIIAKIEERISAWTFLPKENGEDLHVMHYGYEATSQNLNYFDNNSTQGLSEPLMATVILYLSNVSHGGEILFPHSEVGHESWSDCSKISDVFRPVKGSAILFFTMHPNASPDKRSFHARCPVPEEEMRYAAKFFQIRAAKQPKVLRAAKQPKVLINSDGNGCTDEDENCSNWAAAGECERNPVYMVGSADYYGTCRKSCNAC